VSCKAREQDNAGIVFYSRQNNDPGDVVTAVRRIDQCFSSEDMRNHVEWLENWV